jgi:glycosyltransferase involved in cell wall biosynthesis
MAEPLSVLHIDTERGWRGGQQQVAYLISHLAGLGVRCLLACRAGEPLHRLAQREGWTTVAVRGFLSAAAALALTVRRDGVRVVHAHSSRAQNLGLLVQWLAPEVRLVVSRRVDFHRGTDPLSAWKYRTPRVARWLAISRRVSAVLAEDGVPAGRIALVHSGVDVGRIAAAAPSPDLRAGLREECGLSGEGVLVGSVGALVPHKDRLTLVRGLAEARRLGAPVWLAIAGEGEERPALEREIAATGLAGRVRLLGQRQDVPQLLHAFDLFALTSVQEGLGTSVLDAMAAGLPVIVTQAGGLAEMVREGRNGLVVPARDPVRLGQAIAALARDPELRTVLGAHNREDAQAFSAQRTAELTLREYLRVLGE